MIRKLADLKSFGQLANSAARVHADTLLCGMFNGGCSVPHRSWVDGTMLEHKRKARVGMQCGRDHACCFVKMPRKGPRSITQYH